VESRMRIIPVQLADGRLVHVEAIAMGGEQDVAIGLHSFEEITEVVEGISTAVVGAMQRIRPRKASVEFGLQVAVESGKLTALLVKGSTQATLKVTLEWGAD
jgi:hypothetical protein